MCKNHFHARVFDALSWAQILRSLLSYHETVKDLIEGRSQIEYGSSPVLHFGICKVSSHQLDWSLIATLSGVCQGCQSNDWSSNNAKALYMVLQNFV